MEHTIVHLRKAAQRKQQKNILGLVNSNLRTENVHPGAPHKHRNRRKLRWTFRGLRLEEPELRNSVRKCPKNVQECYEHEFLSHVVRLCVLLLHMFRVVDLLGE